MHAVTRNRVASCWISVCPDPSGLDFQLALQRAAIHLPIVFLSGKGDASSATEAMKAGAVDFLEKPVDSTVLLAALRRALDVDAVARRARCHSAHDQLDGSAHTARVADFRLCREGLVEQQIADVLSTSERTVKSQRAQVMEKLELDSEAQLGAFTERLQRAARES